MRRCLPMGSTKRASSSVRIGASCSQGGRVIVYSICSARHDGKLNVGGFAVLGHGGQWLTTSSDLCNAACYRIASCQSSILVSASVAHPRGLYIRTEMRYLIWLCWLVSRLLGLSREGSGHLQDHERIYYARTRLGQMYVAPPWLTPKGVSLWKEQSQQSRWLHSFN